VAKADIQLFDLDQSLKLDPATKDFKELYNQDAINQAIDLFIANPYRIGVGLSNSLFDSVFTDLVGSETQELGFRIRKEFQENFTILRITSLFVSPEPEQRRIRIQLVWEMADFNLTGSYLRFWNAKD